MKKVLIIILLAASVAGLQGQNLAGMQKLFWEQMKQTCTGQLQFTKEVTETSAGSAAQQRKFQVQCAGGTVTEDGKPATLPLSDFAYFFQENFESPYLSPLYDIIRSNNGIEVKLKADEVAPLRSASYVLTDGHLARIQVHILKSNALYDLEIQGEVVFEAGRYKSHKIQTRSDVMLASEVKTVVQGWLTP